MAALLTQATWTGGDGRFDPAGGDSRARRTATRSITRLTRSGGEFLDAARRGDANATAAVRYCVDWTEQRHHLSGSVGRGLLDRLLELDWVRRGATSRAVQITAAGRDGLTETFGSEAMLRLPS